jgi:hypothetical protein
MTAHEAIEILKVMLAQVEWEYPIEYAAAIDLAIQALKDTESLEDDLK